MSMPPDGSLSGEEPTPEEKEWGPLQQMAAMQAQQPWRPGCAKCLNGHKIAMIELSQKLNQAGLQTGSQEFMQALQAAAQAGAMFAQNPMMAMGQNGTKPDMIPPVRGADTIANGNAMCALCFMPGKETNLLLAPGGWTPGRGLGRWT
jgi:hypothetical protein